MFIVNLIFSVIFIYLLIYSIYLLTLNIKSFSAKKFFKEKELYKEEKDTKRYCVVVLAKNKDKKALNILQSLNIQEYPKELYEVHMISTIKDENAVKLPDFASGARIHQIENPDFFSKDKALSIFAEKISADSENKFDGFIFLDSDRIIKKDFLQNINKNFESDIILTDKLNVVKTNNSVVNFVLSHVLSAKLKFTNNTLNISRTMFSLVSIIDGGACVIPSNILEKTGRVCFETKDDELKYTLFLASNNIKTLYCPDMETEIVSDSFNASSARISQKIMLLKYYLPILFKKPWHFIELVLSILKPNAIFTIISYFVLVCLAFRYMLEITYLVHLGAFLIINVVLGMISSRLNIVELLSLPLYPLCALILKYKLVAKNITLKNIEQQNYEDSNVNSATIKSCVGNDKKNMPCKLDLVSEDGMRKVVFRYNKKKLFSDSHLRMYDALNDIIVKLKDKDFTLKVCQNCKYFKSTQDGTVDLLKGTCMLHQKQDGNLEEVLIWNGCTGFCTREQDNLIDINNLNK